MIKGILNRLELKICFIKRCVAQKTHPTKRNWLKLKKKNYKKMLLKLTRNSIANHFNNFFWENKLNWFSTWEGIMGIINISKNEQQISHLFKLVIKQFKFLWESKWIKWTLHFHCQTNRRKFNKTSKTIIKQHKYSEYLKYANAIFFLYISY